MNSFKLLSALLLVSIAACSDGKNPAPEAVQEDPVEIETPTEPELETSISDEDWYDSSPKEILQLPAQ